MEHHTVLKTMLQLELMLVFWQQYVLEWYVNVQDDPCHWVICLSLTLSTCFFMGILTPTLTLPLQGMGLVMAIMMIMITVIMITTMRGEAVYS